VFAAVTSAGFLYVYDLSQLKNDYLCKHPAMKSSKAQHVSFNKEDPIILVGDEKGGVNSYKLSESLFQGPKQPPAENPDKLSIQDMEIQKLNDFLNA